MSFCFKCSKGFLLILAALIWLDGEGVVLCSLLACVVHELGHVAAIAITGGKVRALHLTAIGAEMKLDANYPISYGKEIIIALAGPFANFIAVWISILNGWYLFVGINLCFGVLNLLPIASLDGGRALANVLILFTPNAANRLVYWVSILFSGALLGLGCATLLKWGNITLLCTSLWLIYRNIKCDSF